MEFGGSKGQSVNGNHTSSSSTFLGWGVWEPNNNNSNTTTTNNSSRSMDWATTTTAAATTSLGNAAFYGCDAEGLTLQPARAEGSHALALLNPPRGYGQAAEHHHAQQQQPALLYGGAGVGGAHHAHPDPHLVCLKLGKRHYFEDHVAAAMAAAAAAAAEGERRAAEGFPLAVPKRGKGGGGAGASGLYGGGGGGGSAASVPRCQVEGCHVALVNAKDYHRRHKVCEMHSKAPKVVVLGLEQRFCQQCSRFHVVSEFEETKRSCRRRLAGHNERRRKSSHDSIARNSSLNENKLVMMGGGFPYLVSTAPTSTGRALSLLSSKTDITNNWVPPNNTDLSSRSSAALRELIAENRAAILARQLVLENKDSWHTSQHQQHQHQHQHQHHHLTTEDFGASTSLMESNQQHMFPEPPPPQHGWERANQGGCGGGGGAHVTLDLMQAPSPSPFGFLPGARAKTKAAEEDCCDLWNSF